MSIVSVAGTETVAALRTVFSNRALRRINLAWAGSLIGDWAYAAAIAVWVVRYERSQAVRARVMAAHPAFASRADLAIAA